MKRLMDSASRLAPILFLPLLLAAPLPAAPGAAEKPAPVTFHVAPLGDDRSPGTDRKPFATLQRARDAIRALRRQPGGKDRPVTVLVQGGTYFLSTPLLFTPEDSGASEAPVTYAAAGKEVPIFSGGRRISGWQETVLAGNKVWVAEVPDVRAGKWYFRQLWVNGHRRVRARHPNIGFLRIAALPPAKSKKPAYEGQDHFEFKAGDLRAWNNLSDVEVVALHLWVGVRLPVSGIDEKERQVTFTARSRRRLVDGSAPARYYVENALELLDAPGEWYLDRKTGRLYYWPLPGEKRSEVEAIAPHLSHLLRVEGKPEAKQYVEHLSFRGLSFQHAEWWLPRNQPGDIQAAADVPAALQAEGARHCAFEDCTVAHVSGYAIQLDRGCQNNRIAGCHLHDLGAGGIKLGEMAIRDDPSQQAHGQVVSDNHVHAGGKIFHQAVGIWVGQSHGNRIAHNHVHDLYYSGMSVGWTWGYGKTLTRGNVVEFNHVHDLGQGWLSDMSGIYTLGAQPGTIIRNNVFHDVTAHRYGGWGIYFDEGSTAVVAESNLVYRTTHGGFHQHYGKDNVVRNNIFAFGRDAQLQWTRIEDHRSFTFERNIVYGTSEQFLAGYWGGQVVMDHNLFWRPGGAIRFGKWTFEQWQKRGHDGNSLIDDPLFVAPQKGDFRLKPGSPAEKIGFKMPDFSTVGVRPPEARRAASR
jgi:hypothetical protein